MLTIACLCANWCGVCREFQLVFESVTDEWCRSGSARRLWLDIESPEVTEALDDLDITTFPTLAIGVGPRLLFWSEIIPTQRALERLLLQCRRSSGEDAAPPGLTTPQQQSAWKELLLLPDH